MREPTSVSGSVQQGQSLEQWLLAPARQKESLVTLIDGLCRRFMEDDIPIFRVNVLVRTLHPQLEFMVFTWQPVGTPRVRIEHSRAVVARRIHDFDSHEIEEFLVGYGHVSEEMFEVSPFHRLLRGTPEIRCVMEGEEGASPYPILDELVRLGATDYFAVPLQLRNPYAGAISFATKGDGGFSDAVLDRIREVRGLVSMFLAPVVIQQAGQVVLSAYLGQDPARRVLEGDIRRGDLAEMDAVIGFVDIRGYTRASQELEGRQVVEILDCFFTELHGLLLELGGEILKFMGDGALIVFPIDDEDRARASTVAGSAVSALRKRIDAVNHRRRSTGLSVIDYGIALHIGRVLYGNIGAPNRMDFTVIGSAVNLTSRLQGLCARLNRGIIVTREFATHLPERFVSLGRYRVRGVSGEVEVFGEPELGGSRATRVPPDMVEAEGP